LESIWLRAAWRSYYDTRLLSVNSQIWMILEVFTRYLRYLRTALVLHGMMEADSFPGAPCVPSPVLPRRPFRSPSPRSAWLMLLPRVPLAAWHESYSTLSPRLVSALSLFPILTMLGV